MTLRRVRCDCGSRDYDASWNWDGPEELDVWKCQNCGKETRRTHRQPRVGLNGRTPMQDNVIADFREWALRGGSSAEYYRKHRPDVRFEFKGHGPFDLEICGEMHHVPASDGFEIHDGHGSVYVHATVGKVGDEGTVGAWCRDEYHFAIGPRGGLKDFTGKGGKLQTVKYFWQLTRNR